MTSPDGVIPGGSANYGSLAEFAAKTEADWRSEMEAPQTQVWGDGGGFLGHLFQDLSRGKPLVQAIMESLGDALGLTKVWDNITHVSTDIADFINKILGKAEDAQAKADAAYDILVAPRVFGSWHADLTDDVVFASSLVDSYHAPALGDLVLLPITVHVDRPLEAVKLAMKTPSMQQCLVGLYTVARYDEEDVVGQTVAAGTAQLWIDLGDVRAKVASTTAELKVLPLPTPYPTVKARQLLYVGVIQLGGAATPLASWSLSTEVNSGLQPKAIGLKHSLSMFNALPAQIDDVQVLQGRKYFAAVGKIKKSASATPVIVSDNFNRESSPDLLGSMWVQRNHQDTYRITTYPGHNCLMVNGQYDLSGYVAIITGISTSASAFATHLLRTNTINQRAEANLWWVLNYGTDVTKQNSTLGMMLRGDGNGNGVWAWVTYDYVGKQFILRIYTSTQFSTSAFVERKRVDLPFSAFPDLVPRFRFEAQQNSYSIQVNRGGDTWYVADPWVDYGNLFSPTSINTEVGIAVQGQYSAIDDWTARDL